MFSILGFISLFSLPAYASEITGSLSSNGNTRTEVFNPEMRTPSIISIEESALLEADAAEIALQNDTSVQAASAQGAVGSISAINWFWIIVLTLILLAVLRYMMRDRQLAEVKDKL